MDSRNLSPKQARFVEEYAIDHNGAGAAVRAGYAARSARVTASQLLAKPNVRGAVEALERQAAERLQMSRERVLEELQAAIQLAKEKRDVHAMIKGWSEIAKLCGFYAPERKKIEISATAKRAVDYLETLSDEELIGIVENGG
jgi:phage terminase small subunit